MTAVAAVAPPPHAESVGRQAACWDGARHGLRQLGCKVSNQLRNDRYCYLCSQYDGHSRPSTVVLLQAGVSTSLVDPRASRACDKDLICTLLYSCQGLLLACVNDSLSQHQCGREACNRCNSSLASQQVLCRFSYGQGEFARPLLHLSAIALHCCGTLQRSYNSSNLLTEAFCDAA